MFVSTLIPNDKYSCRNMQIFNNKFKRLYLKKDRLFMDFLFLFWNVHEIYNILEKKKSILA